MKVFDLSQRIENGMPFFPGDPIPHIERTEEAIAPWLVSHVHLGSHTGTHIDAPSHFYAGAKTIDQFDSASFVREGIVIPVLNLADDQAIDADALRAFIPKVPKGGGIAIRTDWSQYWGEERYFHHPYLSEEAAALLVDAGVSIVGIDALNVDSTVKETSQAHEILLGSPVLIVENLTGLEQLDPQSVYLFSFLPLFLSGLDGSPVRAVAIDLDRSR